MMRLFYFTFSILILVSCSKEIKKNKRLSGTWNPVTLKVMQYTTGLSHSANAYGTLNFQEHSKRSTEGTYDFNIQYTSKGEDFNLIESGSYSIKDDQCFLFSSESVETPARIMYINKEDLEFGIEKPETNQLTFVLKKN